MTKLRWGLIGASTIAAPFDFERKHGLIAT